MPEMVEVTFALFANSSMALLPLTVRALGPVTPGPVIVSGTLVLDNLSEPTAKVMVCGVAKVPAVSNRTRFGVAFATRRLMLPLAHSTPPRRVPTFDVSYAGGMVV